jgi:hypothetical protein
VESFHLQLICRRVEETVLARQLQGARNIEVLLEDFGGEGNLGAILRDFFEQEMKRIPQRRIRKAAERLCEEYLISAEGRRLSLEGSEITRLVGIPVEVLQELVDRRLLRRDLRADSVYYELGHDSLIEPVLSRNRRRQQIAGTVIILISLFLLSLSLIVSVGSMLLFLIILPADHFKTSLFLLLVFYMSILFLAGLSLLRRGRNTIRRYRRHKSRSPALSDYESQWL